MIARDEICALKENINKSGILNAALLSITSLVFNQVFHQESGGHMSYIGDPDRQFMQE